jgi:hypothetical protein
MCVPGQLGCQRTLSMGSTVRSTGIRAGAAAPEQAAVTSDTAASAA